MPYAQVAVDAPAGHAIYTYGVPEGLSAHIGQLVWVPFGTRVVRGIIVDLIPDSDQERIRPIASLSEHVALSQQQLSLASFISSRYLSSLFSACALFLPPGTQRRPREVYEATAAADDVSVQATPFEAELLRRIRAQRVANIASLRALGSRTSILSALSSLVERGLLIRSELPSEPRARSKTELIASLTHEGMSALGRQEIPAGVRGRRQYQVLRYLYEHGGVSAAPELRVALRCTPALLRSLESHGLVDLREERIWRGALQNRAISPSPPILLTLAQQRALSGITDALDRCVFSQHLLFGVTGSGKTEVYLRATEHALAAGRQVFCLVPEIALAAQTVDRFLACFPGRVALLHSGLNAGQLYDEWDRVGQGAADIVIGARSALFAPLPRPGLIVLDEEHEWTYKQDDVAPRYHAREVAREMARMSSAVLVLGSATPDVETYHRTQAGDTELHVLPDRIGGAAGLPCVEVVDMKRELRGGNTGLFSRSLRERLSEAVSRGEQALLFLNRRGTATLVQCRHCGHAFSCPRCSVALAYHGVAERLTCHRCGYTSPVPTACPRCRSRAIRFLGIGTQRVADEVKARLPEARVIRWDSDVSAKERGGTGLRDAVREHRVDVIVGTQMVAKGHDFPEVTLVGIVSADIGLAVPDYRSTERTFQLISQASGRAGRGERPGWVVVQTYSPDNYIIRSAAAHDYQSFYAEEARYRRDGFYPPFSSIIHLVYSHTNEDKCRKEVERVHQEITSRIGSTDIRVTGPGPAYIQRLRGRYRWHITVRGTRPEDVLLNVMLPRGWVVDVDPASVA